MRCIYTEKVCSWEVVGPMGGEWLKEVDTSSVRWRGGKGVYKSCCGGIPVLRIGWLGAQPIVSWSLGPRPDLYRDCFNLKFTRSNRGAAIECSHPAVYYYLNNHKIPVKTQHIISIVLYSDMFRLVSHHQAIFKHI